MPFDHVLDHVRVGEAFLLHLTFSLFQPFIVFIRHLLSDVVQLVAVNDLRHIDIRMLLRHLVLEAFQTFLGRFRLGIVDKNQHVPFAADLIRQLVSPCSGRLLVVRLDGTLDSRIFISGIQGYDGNAVLRGKIKLHRAGVLVNTCNPDHIRVAGQLLIQDIYLLINILRLGRPVVSHLYFIISRIAQLFIEILGRLHNAAPYRFPKSGCF